MGDTKAPPLPPKTRKNQAIMTTQTNTQELAVVEQQKTTTGNHVVKIRITPQQTERELDMNVNVNMNELTTAPCIRISVNQEETEEITDHQVSTQERPYFFYGSYMSSGQISPSDTLDSGTCSDLDSTSTPTKKSSIQVNPSGVSVTVIGSHKRDHSLTSSGAEVDSDDNESNLSCDSLNSHENEENVLEGTPSVFNLTNALPQGLLKDIRNCRNNNNNNNNESKIKIEDTVDEKSQVTSFVELNNEININNEKPIKITKPKIDWENFTPTNANLNNTNLNLSSLIVKNDDENDKPLVDESTYELRKQKEKDENTLMIIGNINTDSFYNFHLNEHANEDEENVNVKPVVKNHDETFAGYKDLLNGEGAATIRSAKGTVRGVKNRVRAGIATFLQINTVGKSYKEKDAGKVVVYTTTMGIVRETYHSCMKVKQILRTLLVKFEERDMFMSTEYQSEIKDRMHCEHVLIPQVFVDGQHIGDAETIERLNESGELRRILKPYKSMDACTTCKVCGGYRLLPCPICNGSKKSVHRNHFTTEFVALKCMNCDEVGLVKCSSC